MRRPVRRAVGEYRRSFAPLLRSSADWSVARGRKNLPRLALPTVRATLRAVGMCRINPDKGRPRRLRESRLDNGAFAADHRPKPVQQCCLPSLQRWRSRLGLKLSPCWRNHGDQETANDDANHGTICPAPATCACKGRKIWDANGSAARNPLPLAKKHIRIVAKSAITTLRRPPA